MNWKALQQEAQGLTKQARALIEEHGKGGTLPEDVEKQVNDILAQAEAKRAEMDRARAAESATSRLSALDEFFGESNGRQTREDVTEAKTALGQKPSRGEAATQAVYEVRYGDTPPALKTLTRELYGDGYEAKRVQQRAALGKYLRGGERALTVDDWTVLKGEPILTPGQLAEAVKAGVNFSEVKATLVEAADTLGGVLVPEDMRLNIIQRLQGLTVVRPRAMGVNTSRDVVEWPKVAGGNSRYTSAVRVTWTNETPTAGAAATNPTFTSERVPIHTAMAETFLSRNLLEDVAVDLVGLLTRLFSEAASIDEDEQFLVGDGAGKPQGIIPGAANTNSLTEVNSGHASTLTADGIVKVKRGINAQYRQNSAWVFNSSTGQAIDLLKDSQNRYLFLDGMMDGVLLRKPVAESEAMPDVAANAFPILYGDFSGYVIADRVGMSIERYLDSATARINQVVFVMRRRLGGQVVEPWRFCVQKVAA